jgi:hypothetical protein
MKKLIIHPKLEDFLRKHKCLTVFKRNVLKDIKTSAKSTNERALHYIKTGSACAITNAFYWAESDVPKHTPLMSRDFWSALHYKWEHELN